MNKGLRSQFNPSNLLQCAIEYDTLVELQLKYLTWKNSVVSLSKYATQTEIKEYKNIFPPPSGNTRDIPKQHDIGTKIAWHAIILSEGLATYRLC